MKYYLLRCEVPGNHGTNTIYDKSIIPWKIVHLSVNFEGWMGGEFLTSQSAFIVSKHIQNSLNFDFTGILGYEYVDISFSEDFKRNQTDFSIPEFVRILIGENAFVDDFGVTKYKGLYNQLIISERAWKFLSNFNLGIYKIEIVYQDNL